jgi:hypothetical protein
VSLSRYRLRPSTSLTDMKFDLAATHRAGRWLCPGGGGAFIQELFGTRAVTAIVLMFIVSPEFRTSSVLWGRQTSRRCSSASCSRRIHGADRDTISVAAGYGISQFLSGEPPYVHGVYDRAGPVRASQ